PLPRGLHVSPDGQVPPFLPDGIVGAPWFDDRVWTFDYVGERLLLHEGEAAAFEVPEDLAPHVVPLGFQVDEAGAHTTGFPRIEAHVAGEPLDLLFDTGATDPVPPAAGGEAGDVYPTSFIVRSLADRWRGEHPEWTAVPVGEADDAEAGYWLRVPEMRLGGHDVGPVWFATRPDANFGDYMSQWTDRPIVGALGGAAMRGLVVTVDYPRGQAIFQRPAPRQGRADLLARDAARALDSAAAAAYREQHYAESARLSERAGSLAGSSAGYAYFNAACGHALDGRPDEAFAALERAVDAGFSSPGSLRNDGDLETLRDDPRWAPVAATAEANAEYQQAELGDPEDARLVTDDVDRFWRAYDAAMELDPEGDGRARAFREHYLEPGSDGLLDFYSARIYSAGALADDVSERRAYYDAIRDNTLRAHEATDDVRRAMRRMEEIYPPAIFPDVYFLVGRMTSGGTTGQAGLLIGTELFAVGDNVPEATIPAGAERMVKPIDQLPHIVAHELIHYQQQNLGVDDTLLSAVLREGGADFVSDLILPGAEAHYRSWGAANERRVWERFLADKDGTDTGDWLYNYGTASDDWPADLGYFVGERISAAYYERADDKAQAVRDLLELADPQAIWEASGYAERFE
ncbi:MAG TPA: hypothetical protein VKU40_09220, partial [Thermoanaerobaculia bacterium]|nr:hypothetical protein [Thermoanaerobaculia bacterium]